MALFPKLTRKKTLAIATACMMSVVPAFAQDEDMEDLDLGELFDLNMEVTVASKKAEKLSDAPGMIVAWSDKDIRNLGYFTLRDLARQTTGYNSYKRYGEEIFEARGQQAGSWDNNKHLLLVDGIPVHNARNYRAPMEEDMSLIGAQRVEFLKGPGSALYGTGAFYGVISVVPKQLKENGVWAEGRIGIGSEDFSKTAMAATAIKTDTYEFNASASYFDKEAGRQSIFNPDSTFNGETGGSIDLNRVNQDSRNAQFVNFSYKLTDTFLKGFGVGFIYNRKSGDGGDFWSGLTTPANEVAWQSAIPYLKYQRDFTDAFTLNSYLKANHSTEFGAYPAPWEDNRYNEYTARVNNLEALLETQISINESRGGDITAGVNYDIRRQLGANDITHGYEELEQKFDGIDSIYNEETGDFERIAPILRYANVSVNPSLLYNTLSFYGQYQKEFPVLAGLKLTAGFREDIGFSREASNAETPDGVKLEREGNTYSQFSPRAGIVQKWTDFINTKVMYGTALRAPGIKEAGQNSEVQATIDAGVAGGSMNPYTVKDVGPEVIQTIEGSVNLTLKKVSASVAGFYNITSDPLETADVGSITGDSTLNGQSVFVNGRGEVKGGGFDADMIVMPIPSLKILLGGNYSKMVNYYSDTVGTVVTDYEMLASDVAVGKINGAISYNHGGRYKFGITPSFRTHLGYRLGGKESDDRKTDPFTVIDCNLKLPVGDHVAFEVLGRNIAGKEYYQPNGIKLKRQSVTVSLVGQF